MKTTVDQQRGAGRFGEGGAAEGTGESSSPSPAGTYGKITGIVAKSILCLAASSNSIIVGYMLKIGSETFAWFVAILAMLPVAPASAGAWEDNTNRGGGDYNHYDVPDGRWENCATPCADDSRCAAFTFVKATQASAAVCWLKSNVPMPIPDPRCISGTIVRDATGRAIPDLSGAKFRLYDGENAYGVVTFTSGAPGTFVSGTIQIDNLSRTFQGSYGSNGILDLNVPADDGSVAFHFDVQRTSGGAGAMNYVRTRLVGTGTVHQGGSTETGNLSGYCETSCPY